MSASLVGSEMCIRDSRPASSTRKPSRSPNCHQDGRTQPKSTPRHAFDSQVWEQPSEIRLASELKTRDSTRNRNASRHASEFNI
eukprot:15040441-Alexandrium_andersonii.AAC.1